MTTRASLCDGTGTATVSAHPMMRNRIRGLAGAMNPMDSKRGVDRAVAPVVDGLLAMGVIDPAKVARPALHNAASSAGLFLTTDCMIAQARPDQTVATAGPA